MKMTITIPIPVIMPVYRTPTTTAIPSHLGRPLRAGTLRGDPDGGRFHDKPPRDAMTSAVLQTQSSVESVVM